MLKARAERPLRGCGLTDGRGFTLVELAIALAVVAVLAAIAMPSYQGQVRKARRAEVVAMAVRVQQAQERWRATCPHYAASLGSRNANDCEPATSGLALPTPPGARYRYELFDVSAAGYSLRATAVLDSDQSKDRVSGTPCDVLVVAVAAGAATQLPPACWVR